jgi:hypothetical protein
MSSLEKNEKHYKKKKNIFNGGNYLLSPLNNKKIDSLNYFSINKKNIDFQSKKELKVVINKLNTEQYRKINNLNLEQLENKLKKNKDKAYSVTRPKNLNKLNCYANTNNSNLNSAKTNNKNYNNITTDDWNKNNIAIINNTYNLKKLYINKKMKGINFYSKNDSFNNTNNYTPNRLSYKYLKTDINNSSKNLNLKLFLPNNKNNIFRNKIENINYKDYNDIIGTPSGLFKKNTPSNIIIVENYNNKVYIKNNLGKSRNGKKSIDKIKEKCPEELHFYYIRKIQKGKKIEKELEGEGE